MDRFPEDWETKKYPVCWKQRYEGPLAQDYPWKWYEADSPQDAVRQFLDDQTITLGTSHKIVMYAIVGDGDPDGGLLEIPVNVLVSLGEPKHIERRSS